MFDKCATASMRVSMTAATFHCTLLLAFLFTFSSASAQGPPLTQGQGDAPQDRIIAEIDKEVSRLWSSKQPAGLSAGPQGQSWATTLNTTSTAGGAGIAFDQQSGTAVMTVAGGTVNLPVFGYQGVELVRGNESYEISYQALQSSGLLGQALLESSVLNSSYQNVRFEEFRINQLMQYRAASQQRVNQTNREIEQLKSSAGIDGDLPVDESVIRQKQQVVSENDQFVSSIDQELRFRVPTRYATAQARFASTLQQVGLNGAQVALVRRLDEQGELAARTTMSGATAQELNPEVVVLKANSRSPRKNTGYSVTRSRAYGLRGATTVPSEYLLSTPADADDRFNSNVYGVQRLPDGLMVNLTDDEETNPIVRLLAAPHFGLFYDTGVLEAGNANFASLVALDGGNNPAAGQTGFLQDGEANTALDLLFDTQVLSVGGYSMQAFVDANNDRSFDDLDVEHLGFRVYNRTEGTRFEGWSLVIGKVNSLFGTADHRPLNIQVENGSLVGFAERTGNELPQLALHMPLSNFATWRVAIEEPYTGDVLELGGNNLASSLTRWPTFSSNFEVGNGDSDLIVGTVLRTLGYQDTLGQEFFDAAWGVSATGRLSRGDLSLYFGVAGGDGIGDYIQGVANSAFIGVSQLESLEGYGSFLGIKNIRRKCTGAIYDQLNVAYGYSWMETPGVLAADTNQKLQQAWVNYQRHFSDYMAVGVQWEYGFRQIADGDQGENNRISVILSLRTGPTKNETQVRGANAQVAAAYQGGGGIDGDLMMTSSASEPYLLNGSSVTETIRQNQRGGPAYRQRF